MMDFIHEFKAAIAAAGLTPPDDIIADGTIQKFSTNGRPTDKSGWYKLHGDERPAGSFGCWRADFTQKWSYSKSKPLTAEEKAAWRKRMETLDAERKQQEAEARAYAAKTAKQMWEAARDDAAHPYLAKKKIPAIGARVLKDMLLIPVKQSATEFVGLQRIWPDGTKRPIKGTPMAGAYAPIGKPERGQKLVICEGWATGVTIHMFTQLPVIVAFNSGNLKPVVEKLQAKLAGFELVIAADDDYQTTKPDGTPWNPGLEAAYATGLPVYIPRWYGDRTGGTDFNDLYIDEGGKAVAECFEMPVPPPIPTKTVDKPVENTPEQQPGPEQIKEPEPVTAVDNVQEYAADIPEYINNMPGEGLTPEQLSDIGRQTPNGPTIIFSTSPMQTAEKFAEKMPGGGRILFWRGDFYAWDGCRYALQDRVRIEQRLYHFMAQCWTEKTDPKTKQVEVIPFNPKRNLVDDVYHALRAVCFVDLPEPQCWIDEHQADYPPHEIVAFRNGFLHWPSRTMMKPTDRLFVVNVIDFDFDPNAPEPAEWNKFLGNLWADDHESVETLAEMFGYLLTDDVSQQKMFMLIGPPRSGKGTILRVLESMVGYHNRVSPSMSSLGTQFGLQPLIGKRVAMISDARLSGKADQQPIVECLLTISGEDSMTVQRKHIGPWEGKLPTRFVLASNEIPAFSDASSALASRFILFKFTQSFLGREDHGLTSRLLKELPGIVLWALAGLDRLKQRGYLLQPQSSNDIAQDLLEQTSPVRTFVSERCVIGGQEYTVDKDDLFKEWKLWCIEQGRDFPGTKISFGRQLSAAFAGIKRCQPRENGTRLNLYQGIRLKLHFEQD